MTPKQFKQWRKALDLSQKQAAHALGLKNRMVQYYERGERDGKKVDVPLAVRLACFALSHGVGDFDGESTRAFVAPEKKRKKREKAIKLEKFAREETAGAGEPIKDGDPVEVIEDDPVQDARHHDGAKPGE